MSAKPGNTEESKKSVQSFLEVEAKFSVPQSLPTPELTALPGVESISTTRKESLSAIYYDTKDLRLTRAKITLRRRTGGHDDGWHIKLPGAAGRMELHAELGQPVDGVYTVPSQLLTHVRSIIRNFPVEPIAQVDNQRTEQLLVDATGAAHAEFCDDHVTARSFLPGGKQSSWREWEIELAGDLAGSDEGTSFMNAATEHFIASGAQVSASPSKLTSALGDSLDNAPLPPSLLKPDVNKKSAAAAVIKALAANRNKLVEYDPKVRADEWDSIHQMRVATRELRSHMETFHGIIGGDKVAHVEAELKVLANILGSARDAEVVEQRWQSLLAAEDSGVLDETTRNHIANDMGREYARAHRKVVAALDSDRYLDLLNSLDELLAQPPVSASSQAEHSDTTGDECESEEDKAPNKKKAKPTKGEKSKKSKKATKDIEYVLAAHLDEAYQRLLKRHRKASKNWNNDELSLHEREAYFHDVRKAAKKLRYAAEAAGSATKLKTKGLYAASKKMQSLLGDFQDSVTSREKLLRLARSARRRGEDTFGYGVLYERERTTGLDALEDYEACMKDIKQAYKSLNKQLKK